MTPLRIPLALVLVMVAVLLAAGCAYHPHNPAAQVNTTAMPTNVSTFPIVTASVVASPTVSQISTNVSLVDPIIGAWRYTTINGNKGGVERNIHFYCDTYFETYTYCESEAGPCHSSTPIQGTWKSLENGTYIFMHDGATQHWVYSPSQDTIFERDLSIFSREGATNTSDPIIGSWGYSTMTGNQGGGSSYLNFKPDGTYWEDSEICEYNPGPCHGFAPIQGTWKSQNDDTYILIHDGITQHWEYSPAQDVISNIDYTIFSRNDVSVL